MKYDFFRNKYDTELLIDCFQQQSLPKVEAEHQSFLITFYEIIFITHGEGKFRLDEEIIPFKPGTVMLLPPNKWREWQSKSKDFEATYLIFEEESISTFFNDSLYLYRLHYFYNINTPSYLHIESSVLSKLLLKLDELKAELLQVQSDTSHLLRAILYYILIFLNRRYKKVYDIQPEFYKVNNVLRFKKLLEANIREKQRVQEYAELLEISTSNLNKMVNTYFGQSCSELIKKRLITEIKRELLFTSKGIAEISYDLNFSEPSNFNRFFYNAVKLTPKDFRIQNDKS